MDVIATTDEPHVGGGGRSAPAAGRTPAAPSDLFEPDPVGSEVESDPVGTEPVDSDLVESDLVESDLLVEDVSIDGMCGVY